MRGVGNTGAAAMRVFFPQVSLVVVGARNRAKELSYVCRRLSHGPCDNFAQ